MENKKIVVITSKKTLASKLLGDLEKYGFVSYEKISGTIKENRIIIQINSLHRLAKNYFPDYIIIDEVKDFCTYVCSEHFIKGHNTYISYLSLECYVE